MEIYQEKAWKSPVRKRVLHEIWKVTLAIVHSTSIIKAVGRLMSSIEDYSIWVTNCIDFYNYPHKPANYTEANNFCCTPGVNTWIRVYSILVKKYETKHIKHDFKHFYDISKDIRVNELFLEIKEYLHQPGSVQPC